LSLSTAVSASSKTALSYLPQITAFDYYEKKKVFVFCSPGLFFRRVHFSSSGRG
jgi:hypothetical protein